MLIGCSPALPISSSRRRHKAKKSTVFCLGILSQLKLKAGIKTIKLSKSGTWKIKYWISGIVIVVNLVSGIKNQSNWQLGKRKKVVIFSGTKINYWKT